MQSRGVSGAVALVVALACANVSFAGVDDDIRTAEQLAWDKRFVESESLYRDILRRVPASGAATLGLARVVMWQGRYQEAIALFDSIRPPTPDSLEGRATAEYWGGDLRSAARDFARVLQRSPDRENARKSLAEIRSLAVPTQRITIGRAHDDQPLSAIRSEAEAAFYSDPQTRWTAAAGGYHLDAPHVGDAGGAFARIANDTTFGRLTIGGTLGLFTFPDGVRRPIGGVSARYRQVSLSVERREELATATAIRTHGASTAATLRWTHEKNWLAAVEVSSRRYFDDNTAHSVLAYAVAPIRRNGFTFWAGASAAVRDTEESRFRITNISGTRDGDFFRDQYRGEYDPYWTPDDLAEARLVAAVERRFDRLGVKLHGDGGFARDRGRAFGPDAGPGSFPASTFEFAFDRSYRPWRAGISLDYELNPTLRLEAGAERSVTVDYRSNNIHVSLVRRR